MVCDACTFLGLRKFSAYLTRPFPIVTASGVMRAKCLRFYRKLAMQRMLCTVVVLFFAFSSVTVVS